MQRSWSVCVILLAGGGVRVTAWPPRRCCPMKIPVHCGPRKAAWKQQTHSFRKSLPPGHWNPEFLEVCTSE